MWSDPDFHFENSKPFVTQILLDCGFNNWPMRVITGNANTKTCLSEYPIFIHVSPWPWEVGVAFTRPQLLMVIKVDDLSQYSNTLFLLSLTATVMMSSNYPSGTYSFSPVEPPLCVPWQKCFQTFQKKKIHIFNAHFEVMNQRPIIPK